MGVGVAAAAAMNQLDALIYHPIVFGIIAAVVAGTVRWSLSPTDREGRIKTWAIQIGASLLAVWMTTEALESMRWSLEERPLVKLFFAFVAKDALHGIVVIVGMIRDNPMAALDMIGRLREALRGGPKP